jgi:serine/threonine protein kinase
VQKDIKFSSHLTGDPFILNKIWKVWEKNWPFAKTFKSIIHGDTNCSNILIDTEHDLAILIDFASVKNDGHFLQDLTKIEREIRCRLMGLEKVDFYSYFLILHRLNSIISGCIFLKLELQGYILDFIRGRIQEHIIRVELDCLKFGVDCFSISENFTNKQINSIANFIYQFFSDASCDNVRI